MISTAKLGSYHLKHKVMEQHGTGWDDMEQTVPKNTKKSGSASRFMPRASIRDALRMHIATGRGRLWVSPCSSGLRQRFEWASSGLRLHVEQQSNNSRSAPEPVPNNCRTTVEQLSNSCRTAVEQKVYKVCLDPTAAFTFLDHILQVFEVVAVPLADLSGHQFACIYQAVVGGTAYAQYAEHLLDVQ
nr:hypothetical protein [Sphingobacterium sp. xlx-183]